MGQVGPTPDHDQMIPQFARKAGRALNLLIEYPLLFNVFHLAAEIV